MSPIRTTRTRTTRFRNAPYSTTSRRTCPVAYPGTYQHARLPATQVPMPWYIDNAKRRARADKPAVTRKPAGVGSRSPGVRDVDNNNRERTKDDLKAVPQPVAVRVTAPPAHIPKQTKEKKKKKKKEEKVKAAAITAPEPAAPSSRLLGLPREIRDDICGRVLATSLPPTLRVKPLRPEENDDYPPYMVKLWEQDIERRRQVYCDELRSRRFGRLAGPIALLESWCKLFEQTGDVRHRAAVPASKVGKYMAQTALFHVNRQLRVEAMECFLSQNAFIVDAPLPVTGPRASDIRLDAKIGNVHQALIAIMHYARDITFNIRPTEAGSLAPFLAKRTNLRSITINSEVVARYASSALDDFNLFRLLSVRDQAQVQILDRDPRLLKSRASQYEQGRIDHSCEEAKRRGRIIVPSDTRARQILSFSTFFSGAKLYLPLPHYEPLEAAKLVWDSEGKALFKNSVTEMCKSIEETMLANGKKRRRL